MVTDDAPGPEPRDELQAAARRTFGPPRRTRSYQQYTVEVRGANLPARLG